MNIQIDTSVIPPLPVAFKFGCGLIHNNHIYVGLGTAKQAWYVLDLAQENWQWQRLADFPASAREQASAVVYDNAIYVLGGVIQNEQGIPQVANEVYRYDIATNAWAKLNTLCPKGALAGHSSVVYDNKILTVGGINEAIFNNFFNAMAQAKNEDTLKQALTVQYFSKPMANYFFNKSIIAFDPLSLEWSHIRDLPHYGLAGAAVALVGDELIVAGGERKPGLRSAQSFSLNVATPNAKWQALDDICAPDGLAAPIVGLLGQDLVLAGGTYFSGAAQNYEQGKYYAQQGLQKHYSDSVYILKNKEWQNIATLPQGLAHAVTVAFDNSLIVMGGETSQGQTSHSCFVIKSA